MELNMILTLAGGLVVLGVLGAAVLVTKRTAYLGPVKEELQKEKMWLRRGEYNAAMVKGRQNLELLLKLVAEKNGIQLDNTAQAVANAREEMENQKGAGKRGGRGKEKKIMTHHQFNRWLSENGYLDRVAKWEMNQVRLIGNKAVHENYADKDDAWNQFNYLEDILKTVSEKSQNPKKHHERKGAEAKEGQKAESGQKAKNAQKPESGQKTKNAQKAQNAQKAEGGQKAKNAQKIEEGQKVKNVQKTEEGQKTKNAQDPEMQEQKKRKRRRRRSKKPSEGSAATAAVDVETVVPVEEKATEQKDTAPSDDMAKAKKRRRRRHGSKRPQAEQNMKPQVDPDKKPQADQNKKPQADQSKKPKNDQKKKNAEKALAKRSAVSAEHLAQKVQNVQKAQNVQKEQNAVKVQKVQKVQETQMEKTDDAAKKKHRRRRRRPKSQADGQTNRPENGQAAAGKLVPEDKHEIV